MTISETVALTAEIRAEARRLGFFKAGVARAGPLPLGNEFDAWLAEGMEGGMAYMRRQAAKRRDPALVLDGVRTLLVLAMAYHWGDELTAAPLEGRISRYAWGGDYHVLLRERLKQLQESIRRRIPGARTLSYVDTGPVMEKVWGAQSALGWMGKHSNLITRDRGSWFFIGVILLDTELDYDVREPDYCGTCTRCIAACPTGAIVAPYVVDARLCISYLTIELRGIIPPGLRPLIGNRIFGCDDCQEVCPWNRFAVKTTEQELHPRAGNLMPALAPLVKLSAEEFNRRFRGSPILRAKRDGFVRNVVIALGNSRSPDAAAPLADAVRDPAALVRAHAVWALRRIATPEALHVLQECRRREQDPVVLDELL